MLRLQSRTLPFAVLTALMLSPAAHAQLTMFADRASFLAATSSSTTIGFEGIISDSSFQYYSTGALTLVGTTFAINRAGSDGNLFVIGKNYYTSPTPSAFLSSQAATTAQNNLIITLPTTQTAIGVDFGSYGGTAINFTTSQGDTFRVLPPNTNTTPTGFNFVGFTSLVPIVSVTIDQSRTSASFIYGINIDNFTFGTAAVTPEPGSLALFVGVTMTSAGFYSRRKNVKNAA